MDASLCHDLMTGKTVTGVLHCVNKTPINWFSKKQTTVETAAKTTIQQMTTSFWISIPADDDPKLFPVIGGQVNRRGFRSVGNRAGDARDVAKSS